MGQLFPSEGLLQVELSKVSLVVSYGLQLLLAVHELTGGAALAHHLLKPVLLLPVLL